MGLKTKECSILLAIYYLVPLHKKCKRSFMVHFQNKNNELNQISKIFSHNTLEN